MSFQTRASMPIAAMLVTLPCLPGPLAASPQGSEPDPKVASDPSYSTLYTENSDSCSASIRNPRPATIRIPRRVAV